MTPLSPRAAVASLVDADGRFPRDLAAHRLHFVAEEVAIELRAQIERVRQTGLHLTHLDGHMFCYEPEVGGAPILAVAEALARAHRLPLRRRSPPADPAPAVHMLWKQITDLEGRCAYYARFLAEFRGPLAELIIHPGKDLASLREFSDTGERRLADYRFFISDQFHDLVRTARHRDHRLGRAVTAVGGAPCGTS